MNWSWERMKLGGWDRIWMAASTGLLFGLWQWNIQAGMFMFCLLLFVDIALKEAGRWR